MSLCVHVCMLVLHASHASSPQWLEGTELQVVVSCPMRVTGTEPRSSVRAESMSLQDICHLIIICSCYMDNLGPCKQDSFPNLLTNASEQSVRLFENGQ